MNSEEIIKVLKALADETRFLIFNEIKNNGEVCACKLLDIVKCNQPTLSHHLKVLVDSGLLIGRKDWKWMHYSVNDEQLNKLLNYWK